jgi:hypothetical protein
MNFVQGYIRGAEQNYAKKPGEILLVWPQNQFYCSFLAFLDPKINVFQFELRSKPYHESFYS